MDVAPHSEPGSNDPISREEKLSPFKLTIAQYIVALVLVTLVVSLWRLQVISADNYRVLAEANRIRKVPVLRPARQDLRPRRPPARRQLPLRLLLPAARAGQGPPRRHPSHLARTAYSRRADPGNPAPLPECAEVRAHPAQAGHHPRRAGLHRRSPQRAPRARDARRAAPPLPARRLRRPPHRLRRRDLRADAQHRLALRLLPARRRSRQLRRRGDLRRYPPRQRRLPRCHRQQPRQGGRPARPGARHPRPGPEPHHRPRHPDGRREGPRRQDRSHRRHGSSHRRDPRPGLAPHLRPQPVLRPRSARATGAGSSTTPTIRC